MAEAEKKKGRFGKKGNNPDPNLKVALKIFSLGDQERMVRQFRVTNNRITEIKE